MFLRSLSFLLFSTLASAASFPVLSYSAYLRDNFTPNAIATDPAGNIYLAGNMLIDPVAAQTIGLVVKLNPQATQYLYVRYLGGSFNDSANALAVDSAGNAYVAGSATSPDFPVTRNLGTIPPSASAPRSFVAKLDPSGELVFSDLLNNLASNAAQAIALNPAGQIIVSGANPPYLFGLDPTGATVVFSSAVVGGTALATDASGNIYVAGTTNSLTYPTTAGAYQSSFPVFQTCIAPCTGQFQGANQYVTKVDPTASRIIFSTAVSGTGNTTNRGLAVDSAGNVYLTGYAGANYPYTVPPPKIATGPVLSIAALPFLSELDPTGHTLLFSVPVGGTGVQVDAAGNVYVGGQLGGASNTVSYAVATALPALANVPAQCLPNNEQIFLSAYAAQVDGASGNVLGSQFIGGSTLTLSGVALAGSTLWIAGATSLPGFPQTTNTLGFPLSLSAGAYLGAVDFSQPQPPAGTPDIGCIVDSASLAPAGFAAPYQLLTVFGTGLGPATGVSAPDYATTSLGGASVTLGSTPAPLLYASSTQLNFAVPSNPLPGPLQITINGVNAPARALPLVVSNPTLFLNTSVPYSAAVGFVALALNADGSLNSPSNPAQPGSAVSIFLNGASVSRFPPLELLTANGWTIVDTVQANPFVVRVDLLMPAKPVETCPGQGASCTVGFTLFDVASAASNGTSFGGQTLAGIVYGNGTK